jgi:hypothetical protein
MEHSRESPVKRADDYQRGCDHIKVLHNATCSFFHLMTGSAGHNLILQKTCFIVKNRGKTVFLSGKKSARSGPQRKTIFDHGIGNDHDGPEEVRYRQ